MAICSSKGSFKNNLFTFNGNRLSLKENEQVTTHSVIMIKSEKTGKSVAFTLIRVGETMIDEKETMIYEYSGLDPVYSHLKAKVVWL